MNKSVNLFILTHKVDVRLISSIAENSRIITKKGAKYQERKKIKKNTSEY
jgi:hypothetical protein